MLTSFIDNFISVEITKNQTIQIQLENNIIDENINVEDISVIIGKTKEISVGKPVKTLPDCSDLGGFTEDFDANYKVVILQAISCGDKKYYLIENNGNKVLINSRYIKVENDLSFNEISNITQNSKYKIAAESYSESLNEYRDKEFQYNFDILCPYIRLSFQNMI